MIGIFPEGTAPHFSVSVLFFEFASFGILIVGLADVRQWFRTFSIMLFLSAWILALISIDVFEGVAIPELIVAVAISAWVHSHILTEQMMPSRGS